ncbi:MAG: bifunctional phosphoribosylaminoimidazolecarboxamide formyltransferase/IMP cyclohydrolase [Clostridia bacterium]|nr:bifunctional phosphoribosylaminoimidazolecarboxamide formyltransferase/IMP cyclohydrolase [Clostridia bacterium]MDY5264396.1 bifunctional phosphoribosylaminoimidazolecarboxamide formyltransferase/IMP cyclohydrolase [Eubacteriales bacterium]MDY5440358.1 bifunctional phosphoribosylaminoimidazolecarboxamide formyltransferase/IMP cyclohydrolase [Eubacteriales bacterium]
MKKRVLISVSDKTGIVELAKELVGFGYEIISTGGTMKALKDAGLDVIGISEITGFPECLDGRVKTLHPNVHAGLLAMRSNEEHMKQLEELNINTIDMVVVNLYPFKKTIENPDVDLQTAIENIDIGGPTMIRAAAKNYQDVVVMVDPADYDKVLSELREGEVSLETKFYLMYKVYQHTAVYDSMISTYLRKKVGIEFPDQIAFCYEKCQDLRYGENPKQNAVFYKEVFPMQGSLPLAKQIHGKELSYNNINDANGAIALLKEFTEPTIVASKHSNPCGVASAETISEAYRKAYEADPVSIFGGIIASNREIDKATAEQISQIFIEIVVAPSFSDEAIEILTKKKNIRLLVLSDVSAKITSDEFDMKKVLGGLLVQEYDTCLIDDDKWQVVTKKAPTDKEIEDMYFAMAVVKHAKSNAIAIAKDKTSLAIGVGQTNRIWSTQEAIEHSNFSTEGSVLASDAFFPFNDCVEEAHKAGITAIVQPGGSIRDQESIDLCDKYGIAMVFTGDRHFKH